MHLSTWVDCDKRRFLQSLIPDEMADFGITAIKRKTALIAIILTNKDKKKLLCIIALQRTAGQLVRVLYRK